MKKFNQFNVFIFSLILLSKNITSCSQENKKEQDLFKKLLISNKSNQRKSFDNSKKDNNFLCNQIATIKPFAEKTNKKLNYI